MARFVRVLAFSFVALLGLSAAAAHGNDYKVTVSNRSDETYWVFVEQRSGADPIVVKSGEKSDVIVLKETGSLFIGSPVGMVKLVTTQVYPFPTAIITEQDDGFNASDEPKINAKDIEVRIGKDDDITLIRRDKKKHPWQK